MPQTKSSLNLVFVGGFFNLQERLYIIYHCLVRVNLMKSRVVSLSRDCSDPHPCNNNFAQFTSFKIEASIMSMNGGFESSLLLHEQNCRWQARSTQINIKFEQSATCQWSIGWILQKSTRPLKKKHQFGTNVLITYSRGC